MSNHNIAYRKLVDASKVVASQGAEIDKRNAEAMEKIAKQAWLADVTTRTELQEIEDMAKNAVFHCLSLAVNSTVSDSIVRVAAIRAHTYTTLLEQLRKVE